MDLDPLVLSQPDRYKLLIGLIVPRPIALVSTMGRDGRVNLAPFSFFAGVGSDPMTLLFCPANGEGGQEKDSLRNAKPESEGGLGEFVVNVVSEAMSRPMAACAEPLPAGQSEFDLSGLTAAPSRVVRPPRVLESPAGFECRTLQVIRTNPGVRAGGNIVLGQVVQVFVREGVLNGRLQADAGVVDAIGRMGGLEYCRTRERFAVPMGRAALG